MQLRAYGGTDVGRQREHNEDSLHLDPELGVFVVADGVGGQNAGEVASRLLVEEVAAQAGDLGPLLARYRAQRDPEARSELIHQLPRLLEAANERIYTMAQRTPELRGMATTAVMLVPTGEDAFICHVGDSRVYLFRDGSLFQLTEDHSLVMRMFKQGLLAEEELAGHPRKNIILRSVGSQPTVEVETLYVDAMPGDLFLLCSDGLSDMVQPEELSVLLANHRGDELVRRLIDAANRNGGRDNITAVVVEILGEPSAQVPVRHHFDMRERLAFLHDIFLFARLSDQERIKVNRTLQQVDYDVGDEVIREGEQGEVLYIVAAGKVGVWRGDVCLTSIGPGGHFGELSFLGQNARPAAVIAEEPCTLLQIERREFLELIASDPVLGNKVLWAFLENVADRLRDLSVKLAGQ